MKTRYTNAFVTFLILALIGVIGWQVTRYSQASELARQNAERYQAMLLAEYNHRLAILEQRTGLLVADNKTVQSQIAEEAEKRIIAEEQRSADQKQLAQLSKELNATKAPDTAALVQAWRPRVASIGCNFELPNGTTYQTRGSGVLLNTSPAYTIATNRHVVSYIGTTAALCVIDFPDDPESIVIKSEAIAPSPNGVDWALITFKPSQFVSEYTIGAAPRCTRRASAGETILILGYPAIGARDDVTATEGIISGFEDEFYITSAKVERGNSGGAAILSKANCYIGTPTYVGAGQIEALARILDQGVIPH